MTHTTSFEKTNLQLTTGGNGIKLPTSLIQIHFYYTILMLRTLFSREDKFARLGHPSFSNLENVISVSMMKESRVLREFYNIRYTTLKLSFFLLHFLTGLIPRFDLFQLLLSVISNLLLLVLLLIFRTLSAIDLETVDLWHILRLNRLWHRFGIYLSQPFLTIRRMCGKEHPK